jgi:hypothetical protein
VGSTVNCVPARRVRAGNRPDWKARIEFEQRLKGALGMLFKGQVEIARFGECAGQGGLAHTGIAGKNDEFSHVLIILTGFAIIGKISFCLL